MVEVFKTSVTDKTESLKIEKELNAVLQNAHVNFDLEDCDNILWIEASNINVRLAYEILFQNGHKIELLK